MPDNQPTPPWQLCDTACRTAMTVCEMLNHERQRLGMSHETLAARSGLSVMSVTRTMHAGGCNLAEILCLCAVLSFDAARLIHLATPVPPPVPTDVR